MLFQWIKSQVKNAIMDGVNEAIAELAGAKGETQEVPQIRLVLPMLSPPETEEQTAPRRSKKG